MIKRIARMVKIMRKIVILIAWMILRKDKAAKYTVSYYMDLLVTF